MSAIDIAAFKQAMAHLAGAVSVITVGRGAERTGFTATSVSSFSLEPPTMLVSLNRRSSSWPAVLEAKAFAINVLAENQTSVAHRFAGRDGIKGNDRYLDAEWSELASGTLGLVGAAVVVDCDLEEAIERHSHAILLGTVRSVTLAAGAQPLLYWQTQFHRLHSGI